MKEMDEVKVHRYNSRPLNSKATFIEDSSLTEKIKELFYFQNRGFYRYSIFVKSLYGEVI